VIQLQFESRQASSVLGTANNKKSIEEKMSKKKTDLSKASSYNEFDQPRIAEIIEEDAHERDEVFMPVFGSV